MGKLNREGWTERLGAWLSAAVAASCLLLVVPAQATVVHRFEFSFGTSGSGAGQFKTPYGVAVNDATSMELAAGDVYVVDTGDNRVERFSATGVFLGQFNGGGTYEVEGHVETGSTAPTGAFSEPTLIAVDNSGNPLDPSHEDVYVVDRGHGVIDKFSATGAYLGQLTGTPTGVFEPMEYPDRAIAGIAIDPSGVVWVAMKHGPIYSFSDGLTNEYSSEVKTEFGSAAGSLGVDASGNFYVYIGGEVAKINSAGETLLHPFGGDEEPFRLAVDPVGKEVYLDNLGSKTIEAFGLNGEAVESSLSGSGAPFPRFGGAYITGPFPPISRGIGVNTKNATVYVTDSEDKVVAFEGITLPDVKLSALSEQAPRSLKLNGTVNPEGKPVTSCLFEYDKTPYHPGEAAHGSSLACTPSAAALGSGSSPVAVSADLTGLTPQTTYYYRLVASNSAGASPSPGQEFFTGPRVAGNAVVEVEPDGSQASATLRAEVDPNGGDTKYYFQYGTTTAYGSYAPLEPPGVDLGSAGGFQHLSAHVQGLLAGADYHYRVVAVQDGESFMEAGPDHTFVTPIVSEPSSLVDGRSWELVSPANKQGSLIELSQQGGQVQAAVDGSAIAYVVQGNSLGENVAGKPTYTSVLSRRSASGWTSQDISLPGRLPEHEEEAAAIGDGFLFEYKLFSPDLSGVVVEPQIDGTPPLASGVSERTLYLRGGGSFTPLAWPGDVPAGTRIEEDSYGGQESEWRMAYIAATPDLSHVLFKTPVKLTEDAVQEERFGSEVKSHVQWNLYMWSGGRLELVNKLPDEEVAHGRYPVPTVKPAGMGKASGRLRGGAPRIVSDDGRFVAWTWGEPYSVETLPTYRGLFLRDMVGERTVRVGGPHAVYQDMNSDGSKVFYLEDGKLFVYEYATETSMDLTPAASAGVQETVSDVSSDGSFVYFVAKGVLASGGVEGENDNNLYVAHETEGKWSIVFIATLSNVDAPSWYAQTFGAPFLGRVSSRVSPDGRYLVFMSERSLTGYDNVDAVSGMRDEEVFLYDSSTSQLSCVSCDPTGARPAGVFDTDAAELLVDREGVWTSKEGYASFPRSDHWLAGSVPGWNDLSRDPVSYQPRYLLEDGRVFFDSPVGLVPQDTNGLEDVYEWEPMGVGSCSETTASGVAQFSAASHGCVALISSGTSGSESAFYDASTSGSDVFFDTTSKLVGADFDNGYDLYDAHVCSASVPCLAETVKPPPCSSGDACKAPPSPQPLLFGAPPSQTFNGQGNPVPVSSKPVVSRPRVLSRAQRLKRALRACHRLTGARRRACEKSAIRRYRRSAKRSRLVARRGL